MVTPRRHGLLDPQFRRALAYVAPYWRRLALVVVLSLASTAASLIVPLLSRDLIDDALLAGDRAVLCASSRCSSA